MGATETQITRLAFEFWIGITIVAFIILRILTFINRKKKQNPTNTQNIKEISPLSKMEYIKIYNSTKYNRNGTTHGNVKTKWNNGFFTGGKCECCDAWGTWLWNIWNGYIRKTDDA